jgi:hypothetical protein
VQTDMCSGKVYNEMDEDGTRWMMSSQPSAYELHFALTAHRSLQLVGMSPQSNRSPWVPVQTYQASKPSPGEEAAHCCLDGSR